MRRRIYWLLPDLESARATMDDLLLARIEKRHIHFVAREAPTCAACTRPTCCRPPTSSARRKWA
jgi:hypothetical protein